MWPKLDPNFLDFLLQLGGGMPPITAQDKVKILDNMLISYENDYDSFDILVNSFFSNLGISYMLN